MASGPDLPSFARPPLTEVALSVQFEPVPDLNAAVLGLAWSAFRDKFPYVECHPAIDPAVERVGSAAKQTSVPFFVEGFPSPRLWFLNKASSELIQVQQDRFIRNWRKVDDSHTYPRYEQHIRPQFIEDYEKFLVFLEQAGIGPIVPNQCEVTYVNNIEPGTVWKSHADMSRVVKSSELLVSSVPELTFEDATIGVRQRIADTEGRFLGRLHVAVETKFKRADNTPVIGMTLTARGQPLGQETEGVLAFFDLGRRLIVRTFVALTTDKIQREWGRLDAA